MGVYAVEASLMQTRLLCRELGGDAPRFSRDFDLGETIGTELAWKDCTANKKFNNVIGNGALDRGKRLLRI